MLNKSCLSTIRSTYPKLTTVERRVADYILANSEDVVLMPIADLAKNAGVAKSAVVRCAKSLGFEGYAELKIALTSELSKNKQLNYAPYIDPDDTPNDILDKIFAANIKTLHDTAEKLDRDIYGKTVDVLASAEHIYVYGIGTSAVFANELQYRLMSLGMYALAVTDIAAMKVSTLNIRPGDVAVGISNSGRTTATIDALSLAKTQGATTVAITGIPDSQICRAANYPIELWSDEIQYPIEAISSRIAHLSMIDALTVSISAKDYKKALGRYKKSHELIESTIRRAKR